MIRPGTHPALRLQAGRESQSGDKAEQITHCIISWNLPALGSHADPENRYITKGVTDSLYRCTGALYRAEALSAFPIKTMEVANRVKRFSDADEGWRDD